MSRCANCGKSDTEARSVIVSDSMYDGEWCCCNECSYEHDTLGCPMETGGYRPMKH